MTCATITFVQKMTSTYYVCYMYSNAYQTIFYHESTRLETLKEQSDQSTKCLQQRPPERERERAREREKIEREGVRGADGKCLGLREKG